MKKYEDGQLISTTTYTNNALNQMVGYEERTAGGPPATNVVAFT